MASISMPDFACCVKATGVVACMFEM